MSCIIVIHYSIPLFEYSPMGWLFFSVFVDRISDCFVGVCFALLAMLLSSVIRDSSLLIMESFILAVVGEGILMLFCRNLSCFMVLTIGSLVLEGGGYMDAESL